MTAPERGTATLAPELARRVGTLARSLVAAGRSWALYPPDHPAVRTSLDRLVTAVRDAAGGQAFSFGVTPDTLLIEGLPVSTREGPTTEAAAWLHNRDILQLSFLGDVASGDTPEEPWLLNTWETDGRGEYRYAVVEAVDPESAGIDPLTHL